MRRQTDPRAWWRLWRTREHTSPLKGDPPFRQSALTSQARGGAVSDLVLSNVMLPGIEVWQLTQILGQHCVDQRKPVCGQMQPLAASASCRGEQMSHAIAIRTSSAISPTNSHLGTVWATKSQGRERGEFTPELILVEELNAEIGSPSALCLIQIHGRTPCSHSASLWRAQAVAFDNCKLTFLLSLP